jgi:hypothetical protein
LLATQPVRTLGAVRVRCGLLTLVLAIAACGSSPAADSRSTTAGSSQIACGPSTARTLASNTLARVYESGGWIYGCARGATRHYRLGNAQICIRTGRAGPVDLVGALVGYGLEVCGVDTGTSEVVVQRLSDGHKLKTLVAFTGRLEPESYQQVRSIALRSDGAVAWIAQASSIIRHSQATEVHRADRRGPTTLDSGAAIDPTSLRLQGSKLTWRHGAATRTATLL